MHREPLIVGVRESHMRDPLRASQASGRDTAVRHLVVPPDTQTGRLAGSVSLLRHARVHLAVHDVRSDPVLQVARWTLMNIKRLNNSYSNTLNLVSILLFDLPNDSKE